MHKDTRVLEQANRQAHKRLTSCTVCPIVIYQAAHADEATLDWRTPQPGQMQTFQRGARGNMFAAQENLTPPPEADVEADEAAHPFVTWRTKEFMWSLHSNNPDKWDARSISEQFGVKLSQVRVEKRRAMHAWSLCVPTTMLDWTIARFSATGGVVL